MNRRSPQLTCTVRRSWTAASGDEDGVVADARRPAVAGRTVGAVPWWPPPVTRTWTAAARGSPRGPSPIRGARFRSRVPRAGPCEGTAGGDRSGLATKGSRRGEHRAGRNEWESRLLCGGGNRCLPDVMGHGQPSRLPNAVRSRRRSRGRPNVVTLRAPGPGENPSAHSVQGPRDGGVGAHRLPRPAGCHG